MAINTYNLSLLLVITDIMLLLQDIESYIHRSGRTGRAGKSGVSVCLYNNRSEMDLIKVERFAVSKHPGSSMAIVQFLRGSAVTVLTLTGYPMLLFYSFVQLRLVFMCKHLWKNIPQKPSK